MRSRALHWTPSHAVVLSVLVLTITIDVAFIVLDAVTGGRLPESLHVYTEGGIPEAIQWVQLGATVLVMAVIASRSGGLYWVWVAIFAFVFADDAFMGHERVAARVLLWFDLERRLNLSIPLYTLVELIYMAGVSLFFLVVVWRVAKGSTSPSARRYTVEALVLVAVLVGFAGAGDFIGRVLFGGAHLAEVTEDGGEMIVTSLILVHAVRQLRIERPAREDRGEFPEHPG